MAQDAERRMMRGAGGGRMNDPDMVRISSNENPMGPCKEGVEAMAKIAPLAWRYSPVGPDQDFAKTVSGIEDVPEDHIAAFAGSSDPLHRCQCAFTSPAHSWTMGDPGYGAGAPQFIGSKLHQVPLRADFSHDVEAMIKADPDAGAQPRAGLDDRTRMDAGIVGARVHLATSIAETSASQTSAPSTIASPRNHHMFRRLAVRVIWKRT